MGEMQRLKILGVVILRPDFGPELVEGISRSDEDLLQVARLFDPCTGSW
jgi:hypothetical protein